MKYYGEDSENRWIDYYLDGTLKEKRITSTLAIHDFGGELRRRLEDGKVKVGLGFEVGMELGYNDGLAEAISIVESMLRFENCLKFDEEKG